MNTEQLLTVVRGLTQLEDKQQLQQKLTELVSSLNNLVSSPSDTNYQTDVSDKLKAFEKTLKKDRVRFQSSICQALGGARGSALLLDGDGPATTPIVGRE